MKKLLCVFLFLSMLGVTYEMQWVRYDVDVEDRYDDEAQREGMLRVATSIIEQVREVE